MDLLEASLVLVGPTAHRPDAPRRAIERLEAAHLRPLADPRAPRRPGLYALYLLDPCAPVYVGKTAGRLGLAGRLAQHVETLSLHDGVDVERVQCRFVIYGPRAPLPYLEAVLIRHYRPLWNRLVGFGSGPSRRGLPPIGAWEDRYPRKAVAERAGSHDNGPSDPAAGLPLRRRLGR